MSLSDAPELPEPEQDAPQLLAEPAQGTLERLWRDVDGAICEHCEEVIWRGPGWDWEHMDTDEPACALPEPRWVTELRSAEPTQPEEGEKDHEEMVRPEPDL
jgi:hypothetical protein